MHFVIVGAGALGSIYAAYLARDGHRVSLVARGDRAGALATHGIPVTGQDTFTAKCEIVTRPDTLDAADAVIVAVKTYDTQSALAPLASLRAKCAFSVQNGVMKDGQLADVFGAEAALGAISMVGGDVLPARDGLPGPVRYNMPGPTIIGEMRGNGSARVDGIVEAFRHAGLNAQASDQIVSVEWSKFVAWSGFSALAILTRLPTWRFLTDVDTAPLAARVMRETAAVAVRHGVALQDSGFSSRAFVEGSEEDAIAAINAHGEKLRANAPEFRQSILQDADRNRRLEVGETLDHTLALARDLGVPTPTLDLCCRVLRAVSRANAEG
ncbi:MAG: 2-dehydropantoate 2-reductase [Betaproteobacteria bacterium]|nr:2-dehydropantoate 2-reductase [Betaproteobacteria bacterium]